MYNQFSIETTKIIFRLSLDKPVETLAGKSSFYLKGNWLLTIENQMKIYLFNIKIIIAKI